MESKRALNPRAGGDVGRYGSFRCAVLLALHERERSEHELAVRLKAACFDRRLVSNLAGVLRSMEEDGLVASGPGGFDLTSRGRQCLNESVRALICQRDSLGGLVERYLVQRHAESRRGIRMPEEEGATAPW